MTTRTFAGGTVIGSEGTARAHVVVTDGVVSAVGDVDLVGEVVDVTGLMLFPGMVDTHVHLMDPGPTEREDFPTGTRAAAARGVTTIVEHTHAHPVRSPGDLREKVAHLEGRSNVDFGLAAHVWPDRIAEIDDVWRAGVAFFKIFTCNTHGVPAVDAGHLRGALDRIAAVDGRALIHCEDESLTAEAERALREERRADPGILIEWRNRPAELVAVAAASVLVRATRATATVAHVSSPEVVEVVEAARRWGADVVAEACPQYFALDEAEVDSLGALRKFTPPARIRSQADREAMWDAVRRGAFSHFATDHAPSTLAQKSAGDIWDAPFGLPGLDTTFPFLIDAALRGEITPSDVARLASDAPARRYGLAPRKGAIRVGAHADIVAVDPEGSWTVADAEVISKAGWSPYSGTRFRGAVVATWLRGTEIARDGRPHDRRTGRFIPGPGAPIV